MTITSPSAVDDWDESTPPPRLSLPRFVIVPRFEALPAYWTWDRQGRLPTGTVLVRWVGTIRQSHSGFEVVNGPERSGGRLPAGCRPIGTRLSPATRARFRAIAELVEGKDFARPYFVLAPREGGGS